MKIKKGFMLRKMGRHYVVVAIGKAAETFNGIIQINEPGAFLWNELLEGISREDLIEKMLERYEDLDAATAGSDLDEFLDTISMAWE